MSRPYLEHSIEELEGIFKENRHSRPVLAELREELLHRQTSRAKNLLRDVRALLEGEVRMPRRPPPPDDPEHQLGLEGIE